MNDIPPTLTEEALDEFIALMNKDYPDLKLSREEMADRARRLLRLVQIVYRPIPKDKEDWFNSLKSTS